MTALIKYNAARLALSEAHAVDEVKDIRDKAEAMAAYARQAKDTEMIAWVTEIKVRAERRAGQLLAEMPKAKGELKNSSRSHDSTATKTLSEIGITKNESSRWQKLAAVTEDQFEHAVAAAKEVAGEVTTAAMLRAVKPEKMAMPETKPEKPTKPAAPVISDDDMATHADLMQQMEDTQAENEDLQERVAMMSLDDKGAQIDKLLDRVRGLEGRLAQAMAQIKASEDTTKVHAALIHKLRKLLHVEGHKAIYDAVAALVKEQAEA